MMSRAFLLAAVLAVASGYRIGSDNAGPDGTCPIGWTLHTDTNVCEKPGGGDSCQLANGGCAGYLAAQISQVMPGYQPGGVGAASGGGFTTTWNSGHAAPVSTYHDMDGWVDIPKSRFRDFAEFFRKIPVTIPGYVTGPTYDIVWRCPTGVYGDDPNFKGCDLFLFQYHCPPCEFHHGNLGAKLFSHPLVDFRIGTCAPTFNLDYTNPSAQDHKFAAYMAEVDPDVEIRVTTDARTDFIFWGNVGTSVICRHQLDETSCQDSNHVQSCIWEDDTCKPRQCLQRNGMYWGGVPRCTYCVHEEEEALLPVLEVPTPVPV